MLNRQFSYNENDDNNQKSTSEQRPRRSSISSNPWMNKIKPFFNGNKVDVVPEYCNRVRYLRESCKVFGDLWKSDKDFLNKSIDNDIAKAFKDFRSTDIANTYRSPYGPDGLPSVLNSTIEDMIKIHEYIDKRRREWLENFRTITEQAREKQLNIRQAMSDPRDNYERAVRKLETADSNLRKFQNRDRTQIPNYEERCRELEEIRTECDQARKLARDIYTTETYRLASEEHSITRDFFAEYLFEEQKFYNDIQKYLSNRIPDIENRLNDNRLAPSFHCDLYEHCEKRIQRPIAYPIETCIRLLENNIRDEGIFRIASSQVKQKKFVAELDLQLIDEKMTLQDLGYNSHLPANTLKQYLRELPDCLLTDILLPQWNEIPLLSNDEIRIKRISELINQLPKVNYNNLSYLIRFLNRVTEYSSENKMTASNLGICIGYSLLYPKEQSSSAYTTSSMIIELMITHYKQLFPEDKQDPRISFRSPPPDVIPTSFQSKTATPPNEKSDIDSLSEFLQPSPKLKIKHRAPPPPPPTSVQKLLIQIEPTNIGETSTENNLFDEITVPPSPTSSIIEKDRRISSNIGSTSDRPQHRPKLSNLIKESENSPTKEENDFLLISPTYNDGVFNTKFNSDSNNRISSSSPTTNNNRISSRRDNTDNSTGEITQF